MGLNTPFGSHGRTGRVSFGGGGADMSLLPEYFLHRLPENQVFHSSLNVRYIPNIL